MHVQQIFAFPSGDEDENARLSPEDWASLTSGSTADFQAKAGYQAIQQKRPQTLAFALEDSPAGLLAWNAELWTGWGEQPVDVDEYLAHVTVYWLTRTAGSAARQYLEDARSGAGYRDLPNPVPTAVAVFPWDFRTLRACAERSTNLVRFTEQPRGGHFAAVTDPDLVVADVRGSSRRSDHGCRLRGRQWCPCRSTATRRLCCAPRSWARPTASSRCSRASTGRSVRSARACGARPRAWVRASSRSCSSTRSSTWAGRSTS
ncbi:hypothetical protein GCM10025864_33030 [Luteimicrobium album]|uniref:Epoxide hydrolase n=1 Tax=Luteimicrobium album TaxID=1054550 RepID=A0ABQ6I6H6_9MICO|nr:hypothetical protein GCM10025864_33030 [Luteimicrobium album]